MTVTLMLMNGRICVSVNFPDASDNFSCEVVSTDENIYNDLPKKNSFIYVFSKKMKTEIIHRLKI